MKRPRYVGHTFDGHAAAIAARLGWKYESPVEMPVNVDATDGALKLSEPYGDMTWVDRPTKTDA